MRKIFELEDEFDSALDTGDHHDDTSIQNGRNLSHAAMRRLSGASSRRGRPSHAPLPSKTSPHTKLNTLINRVNDVNAFSPLAQVFNPILGHHDDGDRDAHIYGSPPATQGISYGPASRRRLTSILSSHPRPAPETFSNGQSSNRPNRIVSGQETTPQHGIPPRSRSQDPHLTRSPVSAQEVKDLEDDIGENPEQATMISRLDDIERRQAKIESLLIEISNSMKGDQRHG